MKKNESQPRAAGQAAQNPWKAVGHTNTAFGIKTTRWSLRSADGEIIADFGPAFIGNTLIGRRGDGTSEADCKRAAIAANSYEALVKFVTDLRDSAEDAFSRGRELDRDKIEKDANALLKSIKET